MSIIKAVGMALLATIIISSPVFALSAQQRQMIDYDAVYYDPSATSCGGYFGVSGAAGTQSGSWNSGATPPYILQEFMIEVLKDVAAKMNKPVNNTLTKEHLLALVSFADSEGGDIHNGDLFNPLNTGVNDPALIAGQHSGSGVQSFVSFDAGVEATARGLTDGNHTRLSAVLTDANSTAEQFVYALTYYQKYPGNAIWAAASEPPHQEAYYQEELNFLRITRSQYANIAGLVMGTPAEEQVENLTDVTKLDKTLFPDGSSTTPNPSNDITSAIGSACTPTTGGQ